MKHVVLSDLPDEAVAHNPEIRKRVLLRNGAVPHVMQLAQATLEPGQRAHRHSHPDMWEIFQCVAGRGNIRIDAHSIELEPGTCVTVDPGEEHELINEGVTDLVVLVLAVR